ncbi:cilia- and flagella-associated protein 52-like isoform X2 [Vespa mandarinia]|uniref:cilia- and flagella-associated protein 52-like isoform X2 n=1 Tax=Vespa mandarinia TaxID=7446 RepID=UPI0016083087|nr:cilia- and flagella-associated protein 52-like isoform X2 [Vespa mandarinia]
MYGLMRTKELDFSVTKNALRLHPDQEHMIYPMGNKVTIKNVFSSEQSFLTGHTNLISAVCVSPCGNFVASGQINHLGFKAMVIVWDYHNRTVKSSYEIHKVRVEDVCFTLDSNYLISLGGRDDGNVVIWDVRNNDAMCGSFASNEIAGNTYTITRMNKHEECFLTAGDRTLKVWRIDSKRRKIYGVNVKVGKLRRSINCIVINENDTYAYCGTSSGDIIKARLNYRSEDEEQAESVMIGCYSKMYKGLKKVNQAKGEIECYAGGVEKLLLLNDEKLIVGAGDGTVELIEIMDIDFSKSKFAKLPSTPQIKTHLVENVCGTVTSMLLYKNDFILVGTALSEIYQIRLADFDMRLLVTCHNSSIYSVVFPWNYSEIFATAGKNDIRLWRLETQKELLRISVPNFVCSCLCFSHDGRMIISAWNDGIVRAFTPQRGKLIFTIHNAHIKAVSAVVITADGKRLISGGCDGQVRIWDIKPDVQRLVSILKEHRGPVTSLCISSNNEDLISSSTDGTCIIWDVIRCARKQVLMGNTMYMAACFSPNSIQILTCGTDRKIGYWETWDASLVREIEGSTSGSLNCIDISPDGQYFVTGSNDCIVKLWEYHTANVTHIGIGHAAIITSCKFSPNGEHMVSVSADGAIIIWKSPFTMARVKTPSVKSKSSTARTATVKPEESEVKCDNLKLDDLEGEHVAGINQMDETAESVRTTYHGDDQPQPCTRDPAGIPSPVCSCIKDKDTTSVKSLKVQNPIEVSSGGCHCAKNITETKSLLSTKRSSVKPIETAKSASSSQRRASLQSNKKSVLKSKVSTERKSLQ